MMTIGPIAICGAGIAGLTTALSLARKGLAVDIIEQAPELEAVGAGLQLSPNATRILDRLSLLPALERVWSEPVAIDLVASDSLRTLTALPSGAFARQQWGAPYGVLHRASLQKVLLEAVAAHPLCTLHLGEKLDGNPLLRITSVTGRTPALIVGADGVRSAVRQSVPGSAVAQFSGYVARRLTIKEGDVAGVLDSQKVQAFVGAGAHLVAYPIRETQSFNLVAITRGRQQADGFAPVTTANAFRGWNAQLTQLLERADDIGLWPLFEVSDGAWHNGRDTILIGDAAHAMLPFAAQGAAMAIEDGFELAAFVSRSPDIAAAITAFALHRTSRIARVRARGAFNRFAYHASGPVRLARNLVLSIRKPAALAADLDWLYGYQPLD